jgi:hypothetical protein
VQPVELLPRRETVAVAVLIVVVAVVLRSGYALLQGRVVDPAETLAFALVFAVFYFGALQLLDSSEDSQES